MPARPRIGPVLLALALLLALVVALVATIGQSASRRPSAPAFESGFDGAVLPAAAPARDFELRDQAGRPVSLGDFRGQVTILAFVYSTCGATCVLIAEQIRGALDELARPTPVLLISADPGADTPARVARFLAAVSLTGRVRYLSGSAAALRRVWRAYGVIAASAGGRAFDRAASVVLLDREGRERVVFGLEQLTPEGLAHDVRKLS